MGSKNNRSRVNREKIIAVIVLSLGLVLAFILKYKFGKETDKLLLVMLITAAISFYLYFKDRLMAGEEKKRRQKEIKEEYPFFAQKFSMLAEAGLSPRQIFIKVSESYLKRDKRDCPLYEEIVIAVRELANGVPEVKAYQNFAYRCEVREIYIFVSVINQNLRKGSAHLSEQIRKISDEAIRERKGEIKKKGELAGSKLLFPMMMLLVIVFVIIMVPAFMSFASFF